MSYHIVPSVALGAAGQCVTVPYTDSWGASSSGGMCAATDSQCSCGKCTQQVLNDLGYGPVVVGKAFGAAEWAAFKRAADALGVPYAGGYPKADLCKALMDKWTAPGGPGGVPPAAPPETPPSAPPSEPPPTPPTMKPGVLKFAPIKRVVQTNGGGGEAAGWWASQTDTTRYLIIGGAVIALGAGAYFLLMPKKRATATANPRRRRRGRWLDVERALERAYRRGDMAEYRRIWNEAFPPGLDGLELGRRASRARRARKRRRALPNRRRRLTGRGAASYRRAVLQILRSPIGRRAKGRRLSMAWKSYRAVSRRRR